MHVGVAYAFVTLGGLFIVLNWAAIIASRPEKRVSGFPWVGGVLASVGFAILPGGVDARLILLPWAFEPYGWPLVLFALWSRRRPPPAE